MSGKANNQSRESDSAGAVSEILLVNDNSAHSNWGAQATMHALVRLLRRRLPEVAVKTLPYSWLIRSYRRLELPMPGDRVFRVGAVPYLQTVLRNLSRPVEFFPRVADDFECCADEWLAGQGGPPAREFVELARQSSVVLYNAENSMYRNTIEGCRALFLLWLARARLGKPSCAVNQTSHINDVQPTMRGMIRLVYPSLDLVTVREPRSLQNLRSLGVDNAELVPDVTFSLRPEEYPREAFSAWSESAGLGRAPYFCLSASALPASAPRGSWDGELAALVRALKGVVPRAVLVARDAHCQYLKEVAGRTDSLFFGPQHAFSELWPLFEGAAFLVSGHYHNLIFAAQVGCPFVPLSANNHKVQGVCELLGWQRVEPFDITTLRQERGAIVAEAEDVCRHRELLGAALRQRAGALRDGAEQLGVRVASLLAAASGSRGEAPERVA